MNLLICEMDFALKINEFIVTSFRLKPVKTRTQPIGEKLENGTSTGLIRMLGTNEAQVILRSKFLTSDELDYTLPIWKSK